MYVYSSIFAFDIYHFTAGTALARISVFLKVLCAFLAFNVIRIQKWPYLTFCPLYLNGDNIQ